MGKRVIACILILSLLLSLCGCFPTKERNAGGNDGKITLEQLASTQGHVQETPFKNFVIEADVKIVVKNSFEIYKGKDADFDINSLQNIFLKDKTITSTYSDDSLQSVETDDGSSVAINHSIYGNSYDFNTQEDIQRKLFGIWNDYQIKPNRDTFFPRKELDFMSSENAVSIVDNVIRQMNIPVLSYSVYSIDYGYLKKYDEEFLRLYGDDEEYINRFYVEHTKDDEFYVIIPQVSMPNGSAMAEDSATVKIDELPIIIESGNIYGIVGKNGLLEFSCDGYYTCEADGKAESIISLDAAVSKLKEKYRKIEIMNNITVYDIKLSYFPYLNDKETKTFTLKPTWIFHLKEEVPAFKETYSDTTKHFTYKTILYDAVTGEEVLTQ